MAKVTLSGMIVQGMEAGHYKRVADDMVFRMLPFIRRRGLEHCKRLDNLGFTSWAVECRECICNSTVRNATANIICTVKTHKPAGQVVARILHASTGLSTEGTLGCHTRLA